MTRFSEDLDGTEEHRYERVLAWVRARIIEGK